MNYQIKVCAQQLPLKTVFRIARGAKMEAAVVVAVIFDGKYYGWAEAVPYARYGESMQAVVEQINHLSNSPINKNSIDDVVAALPAGAARNALDCALWDLKAKQQHASVAQLLSLEPQSPCVTAQTLSIDTSLAMSAAVTAMHNPPLVKVKLDNVDIVEKMTAIQQAAPDSRFIVDANESWSIEDLKSCCGQLKLLNVILIEQPLPADNDQMLLDYDFPIPLCADESCHTRADLDYLQGRYQVVNIKLDKTGGLTEAVHLAAEAKSQGFDLMLGCMVGSSLAMAPASLLASQAQFVDLDGPLLIADDRPFGFEFEQGVMQPLQTSLWGGSSDMEYSMARELFNH